jgi:AraC family transcriptional regulator, ethanolamine operon transcriptional activator
MKVSDELKERNDCHTEQHPKSSVVSRWRLADPNQFALISDWDLDFRQIDTGANEARFATRSGRFLTLLDAYFSKAVHQVGMSPANSLTLAVMLSPRMTSWRGIKLDGPSILTFGPEGEFEGCSEPGSRGINFTVSNQKLNELAARLGIDVPENALRSNPLSVTRNPHRLNIITCKATALLSAEGGWMDVEAEEDILKDLLLAATDVPEHDDQSSARRRSKAIATALACMTDCADENTSISRICAEAGVSWRTLDRAFRERFGIGPKAYHTRLRLSRVRSDILQRGPECLISDVANAWGFWHMGKFARDYKNLFGELPSQTRRS